MTVPAKAKILIAEALSTNGSKVLLTHGSPGFVPTGDTAWADTFDLKELPNKSSFVSWTFENEHGTAVGIDEEGEIWVIMSPANAEYCKLTNQNGKVKIATPTATEVMKKLNMRALSVRTGFRILAVEAEMKDSGEKKLVLVSINQIHAQ